MLLYASVLELQLGHQKWQRKQIFIISKQQNRKQTEKISFCGFFNIGPQGWHCKVTQDLNGR